MDFANNIGSGTGYLARILSCFAIVLLACAVKNYLTFLLGGSPWCEFVCPSILGRELLGDIRLLEIFLQWQSNLADAARDVTVDLVDDRFGIVPVLVLLPVLEEGLYRGPLYLARRFSGTAGWWLAALALSVLFALSHDRNGLALLPLLALGLAACWLIHVTRRFWPAPALHMLYNAYFLSVTLYQSALWGD